MKAQSKTNKILICCIAGFVLTVLLLGIIFGAIACADEKNAAMSYDGTRLSMAEAVYLSYVLKYEYLAGLQNEGITVYDNVNFYSQSNSAGKTYGEAMADYITENISLILIASSLFDDSAALTETEKATVSRAVEGIRKKQSSSAYAWAYEKLENLGVTEKAVASATERMYKASKAYLTLYGNSFSAALNDTDAAKEVIAEYAHVGLLFIRTKLTVEDDIEVETPEADRLEKENLADEIRGKIADGSMDFATFYAYLVESGEGDASRNNSGYYFREGNSYTAEFAEEYPEVVEKALSMPIGSFAEVDCRIGVCFLARIEAGAADFDSSDGFFSDYPALVAAKSYAKILKTYLPDVKVKDKFRFVDFQSLPFDLSYNPKGF